MHREDGVIIVGITEDGSDFRPSNWIARLCSLFATVKNRRVEYHPFVRPCFHDGKHCLFVDNRLQNEDKPSFDYILSFAIDNTLQVLMPQANSDDYSSAA